MGTVLRIGPDRIVTLDEHSYFVEIEKCDRADWSRGCIALSLMAMLLAQPAISLMQPQRYSSFQTLHIYPGPRKRKESLLSPLFESIFLSVVSC